MVDPMFRVMFHRSPEFKKNEAHAPNPKPYLELRGQISMVSGFKGFGFQGLGV